MSILLANPERLATEAVLSVIQPPPPVDYLAWAKDNIVFSERESSFPGPYNEDLFPYWSEVLRALGPDDPCRVVTLKAGAQLGKTVLANIFVTGTQAMEPCDFLYVHPTEENGRRWSRLKLKPMLRNTVALARVFPEKSRDGGDAIMFKERADGRGSIQISGANSPASLSMISMPRQVQDDLSKWENSQSAGDPEGLADSRSRAYTFAKIMKISTPLVMPGCRITTNYEAGTQETYHVPCPHCGHEHPLEWENMKDSLDRERPDQAFFTCPECGSLIEEYHRAEMMRRGRWVAANPRAKNRSFYIWSAYSPLQSWSLIADEWFKAEGRPEAERVFLNDTVGIAYHFKGEAPPWESLRDRAAASEYGRGRIPTGGLVLTLGLDCQKDRVEGQLVAWGREGRRWVVEYIVVPGHISEPATKDALDALLQQAWRNDAGRDIGIDRAAIDGNAWTEDVWGWAKRQPVSKVIMVRGDNKDSGPLLARVKREKDDRGRTIPWSRRFYNLGVSTLKMGLYRRLTKSDPQAFGYVGLPRGLEDEYFVQLTAERRVEEKNRDGFVVARWKKDPDQANEALDTMNQAEGAAIHLGVRSLSESAWAKLEAEREAPLQNGQLDFEDLPLGAVTVKAEPKPRPQRVAARPKPGGFVGGWKG